MKNYSQILCLALFCIAISNTILAQTKKPVFSKATFATQTFVQTSNRCIADPVTISASATSYCKNSKTISYYFQIDYQNDGKIDATGSGSVATLKDHVNYSFGTHSIRWIAVDACGGFSSATKLVKIQNTVTHKPKASAKLLSIELMPSLCKAILEATKVNNFSYDSCSNGKLQFRLAFADSVDVSKLTIKDVLALKDQLLLRPSECGWRNLYFFVVNEQGGWSYTTTPIQLNSNLDVECCNNGFGSILGTITDSKGKAYSDNNTFINLDKFVSFWNTDRIYVANGLFGTSLFAYSSIVTSITFTPNSSSKIKSELAYSNLSVLKDVVDGKITLTNPYARIAADVNKDGVIDANDVQKLTDILNPTKPDDYSTYRFISKKYVFYTNKPEAEKFPESFTIGPLGNFQGIDFIAVKLGDIEYNMLYSPEERNGLESFESIDFQPNPFTSQAKAVVHLVNPEPIKMEFFDNTGKLIVSKEIQGNTGANEIYITENDVPTIGIYFCKVTLRQQVLMQKIIRH